MAAAVSTSPASEKNDAPLLAPEGEDRDDLVAGDEPDDVEVVDRAVPEQPAARRDVGRVRWRLVVGAGPDGVDEPELAVGHRLAGPLVAAVEPTLEPDVHRDVGTLDQLGQSEGLVESRGDRLLAERGNTGFDTETQQRGVARSRSGDDERVDIGRQQRLGRFSEPDPELVRHAARCLGNEVGHDELVDEVEPRQCLRMEGADPSDARKPDAHTHSLVFDDRRRASDRSARANKCQANVRTL